MRIVLSHRQTDSLASLDPSAASAQAEGVTANALSEDVARVAPPAGVTRGC